MPAVEIYADEDWTNRKLAEWYAWNRRDTSTVTSSAGKLDEVAINRREQRADGCITMVVLDRDATRTDRALIRLKTTSEQQHGALLWYHLRSTSLIVIAKRVHCDRRRVSEILRLGHSNFVAMWKS